MEAIPPLTVESLKQFVADQQEIDQGIAEDCAALNDMLTRLAGPALMGIEEDAAALQDMQSRLAEPIGKGIQKDTAQLLRMVRKLATPIDQGLAEDTTHLAGMLARARGSHFPLNGGSPSHRGINPHPSQVVRGKPGSLARPGNPSPGAKGLGNPGVTPFGAPLGTVGSTGDGETYPVGLPGGIPHLKAGTYAPSPFPPPSPSSTSPEPEPDLSVVSGAGPGREDVLTMPDGTRVIVPRIGTVPAMPAPPPPLPSPPAQEVEPLQALLRCCEAIAQQLHAIANALHQLRPDVQAAVSSEQTDLSAAIADIPLEWTDPPEQEQTDEDSIPWADREESIADLIARLTSPDQPE